MTMPRHETRPGLHVERIGGKRLLSLNFHDLWAGWYWKFSRTPPMLLAIDPKWHETWCLEIYWCPVPVVLIAFQVTGHRTTQESRT